MTVMPMFPLGTPLLPGSLLPLHVFEPRYRQMVQDLLAGDEDEMRFGVVLIERGHEVGGGDQRSTVGTVARLADANVTADGRFAIAAVGTERLRVVRWLPDDPYPIAEIEIWPDTDVARPSVDPGAVATLRARVRAINERIGAIDTGGSRTDDLTSVDVALVLYHLAASAPLGPADRQRILSAEGSSQRAAALAEALDDVAAVLDFRQA